MTYRYVDVYEGKINGQIVWRYCFRKRPNCESEIMKLEPVIGVIDFTPKGQLRFFPLNRYGERTSKGVDFSCLSRFADTYEEAVAGYNELVDGFAQDFAEMANLMKKDIIKEDL